ncbi:lipopolysaccharide heptosyltransferase I [Microbacteriaceae bacterium K1510]|nr:lipopolysaccharide heptosyltransferase I [Microbacteriaceae bacterium K1510]
MSDILFIKTSSLGDVIHHMPALTDARRALPTARFTWLVEEAYVPLARLHPALNAVVPVAWRRWRKSWLAPATLSEIRANICAMRTHRYDVVVDTQGLARTGIITRLARGRRHGYDSRSIREPLASMFYDVRHRVSRELHAVERNRILTGLALGYTPQGAPDFGLHRARFRQAGARYAVFLHATARPEKQWPVENWIALGKALAGQGLEFVLPWGTDEERARSEQIAAKLDGARVPPRAPLDEVAKLIAGADLVVGVDTGLLHLAAAFGVPLVAIFLGSEPKLTGPVGSGPLRVLGAYGAPPSVEAVEEAAAAIIDKG